MLHTHSVCCMVPKCNLNGFVSSFIYWDSQRDPMMYKKADFFSINYTYPSVRLMTFAKLILWLNLIPWKLSLTYIHTLSFKNHSKASHMFEVIQRRCQHLWTKDDNKSYTIVQAIGFTACWAVISSWQLPHISLSLALYHRTGCLWVQCTVYLWVLFINKGCHSNIGYDLLFITFKSSFPRWIWAKKMAGYKTESARKRIQWVVAGWLVKALSLYFNWQ